MSTVCKGSKENHALFLDEISIQKTKTEYIENWTEITDQLFIDKQVGIIIQESKVLLI